MNETISLLNEFAQTHGIDVEEVSKFLSKYNNPQTLDELLAIPNSLLTHVKYITYIREPLKTFITDDMWMERYETVTVDTIVDCLYDRIYDLLDDDDLDIDDVGIQNLKVEDEEKQKKLEYFQKIVKYIIETKFGSVVYDW